MSENTQDAPEKRANESKGFLKREWRRAVEGVTTPDCTFTSCTGCGICQATGSNNVIWGERS